MKVPYLLWTAALGYCIAMLVALPDPTDVLAMVYTPLIFMAWIQWRFYREWRATCISQARLSPQDQSLDHMPANLDHQPRYPSGGQPRQPHHRT